MEELSSHLPALVTTVAEHTGEVLPDVPRTDTRAATQADTESDGRGVALRREGLQNLSPLVPQPEAG